ncbi:MAG: fungal specific transcription factor domain-containing protein, partial [Cytophagaceae bacterium]
DHDKQLRQRVFWSLYAIDRFICQSMGLPLGVADDDVDVCFPSSEAHTNENDFNTGKNIEGLCQLFSYHSRSKTAAARLHSS